jgi:hypothetical protein
LQRAFLMQRGSQEYESGSPSRPLSDLLFALSVASFQALFEPAHASKNNEDKEKVL